MSSKEKNERAAEAPPVTLMYVGPRLRDPMPLQTGSVFPTGLPDILQRAVAADANLAALFLPVAEAGKALRDLEKGEGPLLTHLTALRKKASKAAKGA